MAGAPRIALNAVAPKPYRAIKAEAAVAGKAINEKTAEAAEAAAVEDTKPLNSNNYKVQIARTCNAPCWRALKELGVYSLPRREEGVTLCLRTR